MLNYFATRELATVDALNLLIDSAGTTELGEMPFFAKISF
jgi:hypothetical protein